ncbi:hypothetical protein TrRE_jg12131 [Triparma retinervis]|uniref:Metallo-beta-lactamase domain-containing protein n=1 Tax=Triparma retinervis TaxID=2557542 RepID=A0A9W7DS57_9STRA|nr:hypothetical protein TrRE_jg12131 [Triparma retinervis]
MFLEAPMLNNSSTTRCFTSKNDKNNTENKTPWRTNNPLAYKDKFEKKTKTKANKLKNLNTLVESKYTKKRGSSKYVMDGDSSGGANMFQQNAFAGGPFDQRNVFHPNTPNPIKSQFFQGMSITFLGTGSGQPNLWRNCASCAVRMGGRTIMVDCGEATQIQMMKSKNLITFSDVNTILITHLHADHILGLPGLLFGLDSNERQTKKTTVSNFLNKLKQKALRAGVNPKIVGRQKKGQQCGEYQVPLDIHPPKEITIAGPPGLGNYLQSAACMSMNPLSHVRILVLELWGGRYDAGQGNDSNPRNPFLNGAEHFRHRQIRVEKVWRDEGGTWDIETFGNKSKETIGEKVTGV